MYEPFFVPSGSIQKQSIDVNTVLWVRVGLSDGKNLRDHGNMSVPCEEWDEMDERIFESEKKPYQSVSVSTNLKIESEQVNGDFVFPGIVLHRPGEEGLREEEPGQPEHVGLLAVIPLLQKLQPWEKVNDVAAQGFEARVRALGPRLWDLPHSQTAGNALQLRVHHHQTLEGLQHVL